MHNDAKKTWGKLIATGTVTAMLYTLLFAFEKDVMASFTRTDGLYPLLPIAAAFAFSLSHGAFTGYFWDLLGVKARPKVQERSDDANAL
ncbi:MAG: hypothetical protein AABM33_16285 [Pseudomonadota bacterium]